MKNSTALAALALSLVFGTAAGAPSHLESPTIYENVASGIPWGQTFVAEDLFVLGARWYIGDPTQPDRSDVNELAGVADLVLFDASDISNPHELARTQVQDASGSSFGVSTFLFSSPVSTTIGSNYFIAIAANDPFGLGLVSLSSTYAGGSEALLIGGAVQFAGGRDTSFEVLSAVPIGPSAVFMLSGIVASLSCVRKPKSAVTKA